MKIYRKPFYKTYMMVILVASIITFVLVSPVLVEHFNMALSNGVDIDYLIKNIYICLCTLSHCNHIHNCVHQFLCRCIKLWNRHNKRHNPLYQKRVFVQRYYESGNRKQRRIVKLY